MERMKIVSIIIAGVVFCLFIPHRGFSQNARSDAMGGVTISSDFGHMLYHPASVNDFPDQLMGTTGSFPDSTGEGVEYVGPILAKKSLGKTVNIGLVANSADDRGGSVLRSGF